MRHIARKRFGQHFLVDRGVIERIVMAIDPETSDNVVEIGPGKGALTGPLMTRLQRLHVIEIDRDLAAYLQERHPSDRLIVHQGDALEFDFAQLPAPLRAVGNLPYNVSTPLLFHLGVHACRFRDLHFMLQREVVQRMVARPSTLAYGRLSVMLQYRFRLQRLFDVPATAFRPMPKVASSVVRLDPLAAAEIPAVNEALFRATVTEAFSHRRKTLRNALSRLATEADLTAAGIDPGARAETLSVGQFAAIANRIAVRGALPPGRVSAVR